MGSRWCRNNGPGVVVVTGIVRFRHLSHPIPFIPLTTLIPTYHRLQLRQQLLLIKLVRIMHPVQNRFDVFRCISLFEHLFDRVFQFGEVDVFGHHLELVTGFLDGRHRLHHHTDRFHMQDIALQIEFQRIHLGDFAFVHFFETELVYRTRPVLTGIQAFGFVGVLVDTVGHRTNFGVQEGERALQFGDGFGDIGFIVFGCRKQGRDSADAVVEPPRRVGDNRGKSV